MKQSTLDNIKVNVLAEKIREAVKNDTLEQNMSLLRMEATGLGLTEEDVKNLVAEAKKALAAGERTKATVGKNKTLLYVIMIALVLVVWILPIGIGWKIILSILAIVAAIVVASVVLVKRK